MLFAEYFNTVNIKSAILQFHTAITLHPKIKVLHNNNLTTSHFLGKGLGTPFIPKSLPPLTNAENQLFTLLQPLSTAANDIRRLLDLLLRDSKCQLI